MIKHRKFLGYFLCNIVLLSSVAFAKDKVNPSDTKAKAEVASTKSAKSKVVPPGESVKPKTASSKRVEMDKLLKRITESTSMLSETLKIRESTFVKEKNKRAAMLAKAKAELKSLEARSQKLTIDFEINEEFLVKLEEEQRVVAGNLGEVFGVVRQVSGDFYAQIQNSIVSSQYTGREKHIAPMAKAKSLPSIKQLEILWFELQREMLESGRVVKYQTGVVNGKGIKSTQTVVRVGAFNLINKNRFLSWLPETKQIAELTRQPSGGYLSTVDNLFESKGGLERFAVDPSRGAILSLLVQAPSLWEKIGQGGIVGYLILLLFFVGIGIYIYRLRFLAREEKLISVQIQQKSFSEETSLGRVIKVYENNKALNEEKLQLKLEEEIMRNLPELDKGLGALKVIFTVSPLMGLLGTVTGMIGTFQAITLFGTGDPKLMAGGISQALVTTVLGLVCAIPTLILHKHLYDKSEYLKHILEEKSIGLIAQSRG